MDFAVVVLLKYILIVLIYLYILFKRRFNFLRKDDLNWFYVCIIMATVTAELYAKFIEILKQETMDIDKDMSPEPLSVSMTFSEVETMAKHLSSQLEILESLGYSVLFWQAADILWMNKQFYLLADLTQLVPLQKKNLTQLVLNYPAVFPLPERECAPEVLQMKALPFITHKSCSYYSLALLCLAKLNLSLAEMPHVLHGTKLFYFLERCLKEEPSERLLINV